MNRALGTVLVGGALLTAVVGGAGVARADLSISPRCEFGRGFATVSPSVMFTYSSNTNTCSWVVSCLINDKLTAESDVTHDLSA